MTGISTPLRISAALALFLPAGGCCFFTATVASAGRRYEVPLASVGPNASCAKDPRLASFAHPADGSLAVRYTAKVAKGRGHHGPYWCAERFGEPEERWLVICKEEVLKAAAGGAGRWSGVSWCREGEANVFRLGEEFLAGRVVESCPWRSWELRDVDPRTAAEGSPAIPGGKVFPPVLPSPSAPSDPPYRCPAHPAFSRSFAPRPAGRLRWVTDFPETEGPDVVVFDLPSRDYRTPGGKATQALLPVAVAADLVTWPVQLVVIFSAG